jgi:hypothetical protein
MGLLQDQISRLNQENGSLKQNLTSTSAALKEARTDISRGSNNYAIKVDTSYLCFISMRFFAHTVCEGSRGSCNYLRVVMCEACFGMERIIDRIGYMLSLLVGFTRIESVL